MVIFVLVRYLATAGFSVLDFFCMLVYRILDT